MAQLSTHIFPNFGKDVSVLAKGAHFGDARWLHVKAHNQGALRELVRQCCQSGVGIVTGQHRPLPPSIKRDARIVFVDTGSCSNVLEHVREDQVITVETGITLIHLNTLLAQSKQWFPISYGNENTTVLDVIETGDGGILEHGFGGPRDLVLGLEVITGQGDAIKCGGKVVKNVTGYDLSKLIVGARGTLGLASVAHLRLFARPQETTTLLLTGRNLVELVDHASALTIMDLPFSCLEIVDARLLSRSVHLFDPEDSTGLLNSAVDATDPYFALIAQIAGPHDVIEESVQHVKAQPFAGSAVRLPAAFEDKILPALSNIGSVCEKESIEIACGPKDCTSLVHNWWRKSGKPPVQIRIGSGRMRVFADSANSCARLLESISATISSLAQPPAVSFGNADYEYFMRNFNTECSAQQSIKDQIKRRFDPAGCLNPLARV